MNMQNTGENNNFNFYDNYSELSIKEKQTETLRLKRKLKKLTIGSILGGVIILLICVLMIILVLFLNKANARLNIEKAKENEYFNKFEKIFREKEEVTKQLVLSESKIKALEEENNDLKQANEELNNQKNSIQDIVKEKNKLKNDNEELIKKNNELEKKINEILSKNNTIEEIINLKKENSELKTQNNELLSLELQINKENTKLKNDIDEISKKLNKTEKTLNEERKKVNDLLDNKKELVYNLTNTKGELEKIINEFRTNIYYNEIEIFEKDNNMKDDVKNKIIETVKSSYDNFSNKAEDAINNIKKELENEKQKWNVLMVKGKYFFNYYRQIGIHLGYKNYEFIIFQSPEKKGFFQRLFHKNS